MRNWERNYFNEILKKYNSGTATDEEVKFLESFYDMFDANADFVTTDNKPAYADLKDRLKSGIDSKIAGQHHSLAKVRRLTKPAVRFSAAAAILLFTLAGVYIFKAKNTETKKQTTVAKIVPGGNKALLKLANGKTIDLTDAADGVLAQEANVDIQKNTDGLLVYTIKGDKTDNSNQHNTISTPNGGQYQVILPDGSKVMLNAASSLTYPVTFAGERVVELNGEAYFEVAHNKSKPFKVISKGQTVTVLGTHFNVNAYSDENAVKTTLLQGSVMVAAGTQRLTITPGEQTLLRNSTEILNKKMVDTDKETAWRNGVFSFDGEDVKTVMRQVARWYDVTVLFNGDFDDDKFYGEISRTSSLQDVIKILKLSNVDFEVQDRKIIVSENK